MAWGARTGVDDLLQRLRQPATGKNLCVLSFRKLSEADVLKLAGAIASNSILEELYLSGHKLGAAGAQAFANALATNTTLQHLSIGEDALGDNGVAVLCAGLLRNGQSAVRVWDLEKKSIGADGAAAIGELLVLNTSIKTLNLARNELTDGGVGRLVDGILRNTAPALESLSLMETNVAGAALDHLARLLEHPQCSLQTLQLSFNVLSTAGPALFASLATNKSLTTLYLKETKLTDTQVLTLADALKTNTTLTEIDLSDNGLTSVSSAALADALRINASLKMFVLGGNKGGDAGALALAETLADSNTSLESLDLAKNELTHVSITALLGAKKVKTLRLFNNALGAGVVHVLPQLVANTVIESLDLGANALHGDLSIQLCDQLHAHPSLTTLEMGGNSLGEQGHVALDRLRAANPKLDVAVDKNAQDEDNA